MPLNNFTTGRDVTLNIVTPNFGPVSLNLITKFTSKQLSTNESPKGIDGVVRHVRFFNGWQGSFNIERRDSTLDDYFALQEANYWGGVNESPASITQTILEQAGNVTQWRYTGVLLIYDDAGDYAGDSTVKQAMSFLASKRLKIA
jgi:hypothetical protein